MSISLLSALLGPQHHDILFNLQHSGKVLDLAFTSKTLGSISRNHNFMYTSIFFSVSFRHFLLLFQNHIAIFKQTWHNATLRSNKEPRPSSRKEISSEIIEMH
jgi:hypothetical protein